MTALDRLWDLPQHLAQAVVHFVLHPTHDIHPDRAAQLFPKGVPIGAGAQASAALMQMLGLHDQVPLDAQSPLQRLALMPPAALTHVSQWLALTRHTDDLRRVVLRQEHAALSEVIPAAGWDWLASQPEASVWPPQPKMPLPALLTSMRTVGWQYLEAASHLLPHPIGDRLRLKLPLTDPTPSSIDREQARQHVLRIYEAAALSWNPAWESDWQRALGQGS